MKNETKRELNFQSLKHSIQLHLSNLPLVSRASYGGTPNQISILNFPISPVVVCRRQSSKDNSGSPSKNPSEIIPVLKPNY